MIEANQYIHSVQQISVKRGDNSYISSCVFISPRVALTAAHSVYEEESVLCLGHFAKKVIIHKGYDQEKSNFLNDLAIIIFNEDVSDFTKMSEDLIGPLFYRVGFGFRENENKRASFMIHLRESQEKYNKFYDLSSSVGDSGGGIFNSKQELVGIHSTKEGDETYTINLEHYIPWITPYINKSNRFVRPWI